MMTTQDNDNTAAQLHTLSLPHGQIRQKTEVFTDLKLSNVTRKQELFGNYERESVLRIFLESGG